VRDPEAGSFEASDVPRQCRRASATAGEAGMTEAPSTRSGFQGTIGNLPLVDLLQVWSMNGFSGLVSVSSQGRTGHLYFVEGAIVHAEADGNVGEQAVGIIVGWPEGSFDLLPNTTTLERTILKSLSHLLLEAHRSLDEQRRERPPATPSPPPAAKPPPQARPPPSPSRQPDRRGVIEQIRAIPGVTELVRFGRDGRPAGAGPAAEALAAKGLYLAMTHSARVAAAFGLGDLAVASVHGGPESFVLVHASGQYLCVAVAPGAAIEPVVAQLRALLSRPASR